MLYSSFIFALKTDGTIWKSVLFKCIVNCEKASENLRRLSSGERGWEKKYCIKINDSQCKCSLCSVVIRGRGGNFNNFKRHIKKLHPSIFNEETKRSIIGENESVTKYILEYQDVSSDEIEDQTDSNNLVETTIVISEKEQYIQRLCTTRAPGKCFKKTCTWNFFEMLKDSLYRCTFCTKKIPVFPGKVSNLRRHMFTWHKKEMCWILKYAPKEDSLHRRHVDRMKRLLKSEPESENLRRLSIRGKHKIGQRGWARDYCIKISDSQCKCSLCSVVISVRGGNFNNFKRHLKKLHPSIFNEETNQTIVEENEGEAEYIVEYLDLSSDEMEDQTDSNNLVDANIVISEKEQYIATLCTTPVPGKWINKTCMWNFFEMLKDSLYRCKFCTKKITVFPGSVANLRRHMSTWHKKEMRWISKYAPKHDSLHTRHVKQVKRALNSDPMTISESCFDKIDDSTYSCKYCDKVMECSGDDQVLFKHVQDSHPNQVLMYQLENDDNSFVVV